MMKRLRKAAYGLLFLAPLFLGGCQIFGAAAGALNWILPALVSVGGAVATYYIIKELE